ncbi:hypothetical protein VRK_39350 [Vibrio sp. MEBiC08052]|nr:hypothetical protein VRK_39350 [Vibrio sp. MEBiC08052]
MASHKKDLVKFILEYYLSINKKDEYINKIEQIDESYVYVWGFSNLLL